ncbi:MAG: hypothetical protein ABI742_07990, partial [Gemmatimonadota bacterium]
LIMTLTLGFSAMAGGGLGAQVSPGPLARAHHELEGTLKCTKCHGGGKEGMTARCTTCHKDIALLIEARRGYHASTEARGGPCASCHPDHAGVDFDLVKWPDGSPDKFDHRRTGWPLTRTHGETKCVECHQPKYQVSPAARQSARKTGQGYTGLETTCASCHDDIHRGALGQECVKCHDTGKWTTTPGFSHDSTAYPLTNRHTDVSCEKCHLAAGLSPKRDPRGRPVPIYRPVPHQSCADCHQDVHKGQFGANCASCHSTRGFQQIDRSSFDHSRTKYPLQGRHAALRCAACHGDFSTPASKKPAFQSCTVCHKDQHNGTATLAGKLVGCEACHTVNGFAASTFTVDKHAASRYPLEGKHITVVCASCHVRDASPAAASKWGNAKVVMRPAFMKCLDCHADEHGGQLRARADRGDCAACHRVAGWKPSTFDRSAHATLSLALDGRHAEVDCRACHGNDRKGLPPISAAAPLGKAAFLFKLPQVECTSCHADPHRGRFVRGGARPVEGGCLACHDTRAFRPSSADVAAHKTFGLPLDGAHRATPCVSCHAEMKQAAGAPRRSSLIAAGVTFAELRFEAPTTCAECHETPHGAQFSSRTDKGRCDACHTTEAFQPAGRFDHDRDASFSLKGAHEKVPCNRCHSIDVSGGNPRRLIFRPLSGKCESCHGGKEVR